MVAQSSVSEPRQGKGESVARAFRVQKQKEYHIPRRARRASMQEGAWHETSKPNRIKRAWEASLNRVPLAK